MPRQKKDNKAMSIRIATPIFDRLNEFCEDSGQQKTTAIERALVKYMDSYYHDQELIKKAHAGK